MARAPQENGCRQWPRAGGKRPWSGAKAGSRRPGQRQCAHGDGHTPRARESGPAIGLLGGSTRTKKRKESDQCEDRQDSSRHHARAQAMEHAHATGQRGQPQEAGANDRADDCQGLKMPQRFPLAVFFKA